MPETTNRIDETHRKELLRFLLVKTAAVRRGVKPAELLRVRHCYAGVNAEGLRVCLYRDDIYTILGLDYVELKVEAESSLVLFYNPHVLASTLAEPRNARWLAQMGYPEVTSLHAMLAHLVRRAGACELPHEVGIFIGYPLKDVAGFLARLPATPVHRGAWRVYGGAAVETGAVSVPRLFADATVFAGMEVGAAFGVESPLGGLSATFFSISAAAGVRGDVSAEIADGARSLDVKVRPVVEAEFVPVSVNVFDIVDLTPVEKSWTLYEGPAWIYRYADASAPGDVRILSLPVLAARGLEVAKPSGMKPALALSWLESKGLSGRNATDADAARILGRPSGKLAADGTALYLWHDFVAGTDPSDANDAFRAKIEIDENGDPVVSPVPGPLTGRIYTVEGKAKLGDEWHPATKSDRFFRVKVDLE